MLGHAAHECEVAGDARLHVHRSDAGRTEQRHVQHLVRDDCAGGSSGEGLMADSLEKKMIRPVFRLSIFAS